MFLKRYTYLLLFVSPFLLAFQDTGLEIDFLSSYYDQDGDNSPVNGGVGSEELQSIAPVIVIRYGTASGWNYSANLGTDNVTSASIDAMDDNAGPDDNVSSASRLDNRTFVLLGANKKFGKHTWGFNLGFSGEYDYSSISGGFNWSMDFNENNTTLATALTHYEDSIDLYSIHGVNEGSDTRTTTDFSLSLTQVLSAKTVGSVELYMSKQSGFLSSPFQEVILDDDTHVAERLPQERQRNGLRLGLNHAFTSKIIGRSSYRYYDDDFGIKAHTIELEPNFRLPFKRETWVYPILRYHQQSGSDFYGLPGSFNAENNFYTADRDLSDITSQKYGMGMRLALTGRHLRRIDVRSTYYTRDDGLNAINLSFGFGWSW